MYLPIAMSSINSYIADTSSNIIKLFLYIIAITLHLFVWYIDDISWYIGDISPLFLPWKVIVIYGLKAIYRDISMIYHWYITDISWYITDIWYVAWYIGDISQKGANLRQSTDTKWSNCFHQSLKFDWWVLSDSTVIIDIFKYNDILWYINIYQHMTFLKIYLLIWYILIYRSYVCFKSYWYILIYHYIFISIFLRIYL